MTKKTRCTENGRVQNQKHDDAIKDRAKPHHGQELNTMKYNEHERIRERNDIRSPHRNRIPNQQRVCMIHSNDSSVLCIDHAA